MSQVSPYEGILIEQWQQKTQALVDSHPLQPQELCDVVLSAWADIFSSEIGSVKARIGREIFFTPQIMATLIQELSALELQKRYPTLWRRDRSKLEKDLVYLPDSFFSIEVKASSSPNDIFGNRSYTQIGSASQKSKSGFYLAINFEKFLQDANENFIVVQQDSQLPKIRKIRFGWLDHTDWKGQSAPTGQNASLTPNAKRYKLISVLEGST